MANGKVKGISIGCEFGRVTRSVAVGAKEDVNNMGKKLDKIYTLLVTTLATMLGSIIVGCLVFYITKH